MASLGHIAVGLAAGGRWWSGYSRTAAWRPMLGASVISLLPDVDVVGMAVGVPYGAPWGHRGATHALVMALVVGSLAAKRALPGGPSSVVRGAVSCLVVASHGLFDAMTDGGKGVALMWPFTTQRFFFPWRPIPVAPIGIGLFSLEGLRVVTWELLVFLPLLVFALWPRRESESRIRRARLD